MWNIDSFPPTEELETPAILRQCILSQRYLAELKGASQAIPNQGIIINTLALQEAKDSSAIENIITTQDDLYRQEVYPEKVASLAAKEVHDYSTALKASFELVRKDGLISRRIIQAIQQQIEKNDAGFRKLPGTALVNQATGKTVYTPPQSADEVERLMSSLEAFINGPAQEAFDPLVCMALIHHQFESIHPFYDGNGRTGRIINVLYLVIRGLLDIPVLYLSRYLIRTKEEYYRRLQEVRENCDWQGWLLYFLKGVEKTARFTLRQVEAIGNAQMLYKHRIRDEHPRIYSQDLINNLFNHPYTKIEFLMRDLQVGRITATKYLDTLTADGLLEKKKIGRSNYYINLSLLKIIAMDDEV